MRAIEADVWVVTETHLDVAPGEGFTRIATSAAAPDRPGHERWVAIWVRSALCASALHVVAEAERMAAVRVEQPGAPPLLVVGTVLPWRGDARRDPVRGGAAFCEALEAQGGEWRRLRRENPGAGLCIAGDLNLEVGHRLWAGTRAGRAAFDSLLASAGLELSCVTGGAADPLARQGWGASIDHVLLSSGLQVSQDRDLGVWPLQHPLPHTLSDHYGVWADIERKPQVDRPGVSL